MNEQGLDETGSLRVVQAHQEFRPIFILTKSSLVDKGKDVSKALRNRCQELSVEFDEEQNDID